VLDHFALVGFDEVGLLGWLDSNTVNVLLMLSSVESAQLVILNSFVFVTLPFRQLNWSCNLIPIKQVIYFLDT
jgi:hypothetical protein